MYKYRGLFLHLFMYYVCCLVASASRSNRLMIILDARQIPERNIFSLTYRYVQCTAIHSRESNLGRIANSHYAPSLRHDIHEQTTK
jgi:hypothetical protein